METLPPLPRELILDKLTPQQVIQLCIASPIYQVICVNYWPGRAARRLRVTPEQWGSPANPVQHYLNLFDQCLPGALDKPLTRDCGRLVGQRAQPAEIEQYLVQGGNPEDIAYGAALVGAIGIVDELTRRYPRFANSIARSAVRGAGSIGQTGAQYFIPSMGDITSLALRGAAEANSLPAIRQLISQIGGGGMALPLAYLLSRWGYGDLSHALVPGVRDELSQAVRRGDWDRIQHYLPGIAALMGSLGPASLIKQLIHHAQIDPRINVQDVLESLYNSDRSDVFVEVADWIQQSGLPIDLTNFRNVSREGDDFRLAQWSIR